MSYTLATFKTYLRNRGMDNVSTKFATIATDVANQAQALMRANGRVFPWMRGQDKCVFVAAHTGTGTATMPTLAVRAQSQQIAIVGESLDKGWVGKYLYVNGSLRPYRMIGQAGGSVSLGEYIKDQMAGEGSSALSYEWTDERHRLPADFMTFDFEDPNQHFIAWGLVEESLTYLDKLRDYQPSRGVPWCYAIESAIDDETVNEEGTEAAAPATMRRWLRVYPAPTEVTVIDFRYIKMMTEVSSDSDKFGFQDDPVAARILEAYGLGLYWQNDPKMGGPAQNQLRIAETMATTHAITAGRAMGGVRQAYYAPDEGMRPFLGRGLHDGSILTA